MARRTFACAARRSPRTRVNHHGDGRVALWLNSPPGAQEIHVRGEPKHFFVPPYVGPRGWLGVNLDKGLSWKRIAMLVREAYEKVAPTSAGGADRQDDRDHAAESEALAQQIDPHEVEARAGRAEAAAQDRARVAGDCGGRAVRRAGVKAGKKTFAQAYYNDKRLKLGFWVGVDRQGLLTADERFTHPQVHGPQRLDRARRARRSRLGRDSRCSRSRAIGISRTKRMLAALDSRRTARGSHDDQAIRYRPAHESGRGSQRHGLSWRDRWRRAPR